MSAAVAVLAACGCDAAPVPAAGHDAGPGAGGGASSASPLGLHIAVTRPFTAPGDLPDEGTQPFDYTDAEFLKVGWERPGPYARYPLDTALMDRVYGSVPAEIAVLGNVETPRIPGTFRLRISDEGYVAFVRDLVERYDGDGIDDMPGLDRPITHWQIDNEPPFWQLGVTDGLTSDPHDWLPATRDDYAHVLRLARGAIDEACPRCEMLVGGLIDGFNATFLSALVDDFYRPILEELRDVRIDAVDFHFYGAANDFRRAGDFVAALGSALEATDHRETAIWSTEIGTHTQTPVDSPPQTEADQAAELARRMTYPLALGVRRLFWWSMIEGFAPLDDNDPGDHIGLVYDGIGTEDPGYGVRKLAFYTFRLLVEELRGLDEGGVTIAQDGDGAVVLRVGREAASPLFVAWRDDSAATGGPTTVSIEMPATTSVEVLDVVPRARAGAEIDAADYRRWFPTENRPIHAGRVTLDLGSSPVLVFPEGAP